MPDQVNNRMSKTIWMVKPRSSEIMSARHEQHAHKK